MRAAEHWRGDVRWVLHILLYGEYELSWMACYIRSRRQVVNYLEMDNDYDGNQSHKAMVTKRESFYFISYSLPSLLSLSLSLSLSHCACETQERERERERESSILKANNNPSAWAFHLYVPCTCRTKQTPTESWGCWWAFHVLFIQAHSVRRKHPSRHESMNISALVTCLLEQYI